MGEVIRILDMNRCPDNCQCRPCIFFRERLEYWRGKIEPQIDAEEEKSRITAADLRLTINC